MDKYFMTEVYAAILHVGYKLPAFMQPRHDSVQVIPIQTQCTVKEASNDS